MKKTVFLLVVLALVVSACSTESGQNTTPTQTSETSVPQGAVETSGPQGSPETAAATPELAETGIVTYVIVPEESTVTYEVNETFLDQANVLKTAVGKTPGVTGEIQANFNDPQSSTIGTLTVDISGFTSDSGRRDNAIRGRFLESSKYPTVTFVPTSIDGLPETYQEGVDYPIVIHGDLTIRDTTQPADFETVVRLENNNLTGKATTAFKMSDFGFGPISIMGMLNTEDDVKITIDFTARPKG
jgi:polyisoprenoid-binding protein YceI